VEELDEGESREMSGPSTSVRKLERFHLSRLKWLMHYMWRASKFTATSSARDLERNQPVETLTPKTKYYEAILHIVKNT
jgi:hypothetical protein